jgi:hypothetical protein
MIATNLSLTLAALVAGALSVGAAPEGEGEMAEIYQTTSGLEVTAGDTGVVHISPSLSLGDIIDVEAMLNSQKVSRSAQLEACGRHALKISARSSICRLP